MVKIESIHDNRIVKTIWMFTIPVLLLYLMGMDIETMKQSNILALIVVGALYMGLIAD